MKTFYFLLAFTPVLAFSQSKKEAYQMFKNSNIRKEIGFKLSDFNYNVLKFKSKAYNVPIKNMVILNSTKDKERINQIIIDYNRRNNLENCIFCSEIPYSDFYKNNANEIEPKYYKK